MEGQRPSLDGVTRPSDRRREAAQAGGEGIRALRAVGAFEPRPHRRLAALTEEQIALLQVALAHWERTVADTSYDPQVQDWARTHATATAASVAAIGRALANSSPESDW